MADLSASAITRKARSRGGIVTITTVLSLVAAMGLTWFGLSANDHVAANYDASSWLWSMSKGELSRVNGLTGKVDTRQAVPEMVNHPVQVSQTDRYLILRDSSTGKVSAFDPATLQITATFDTLRGIGVSIALNDDAAFLIDPVQGVVRQLDPATLQPVGEPLRYPPGITSGTFDGLGRLWIGVRSEGTVSAITPVPQASLGAGGQGGASPITVRSEAVAEAYHDLSLSGLDNGVAVLNQTNGTLTVLRGDTFTKISIANATGGELPRRVIGDTLPVTVTDGRTVYLISGSGDGVQVVDFTVPGQGELQAAVAWAGRLYVADNYTGKVYVLDPEGKLVNTITVAGVGKHGLELEVRENHLFINAPASDSARVVNDKHEVKEVDKFANDIPGGDPPVVIPPPPPKPVINKPGAPRNVQAAAGDNLVTLSWGKAKPNGARVTKYVVTLVSGEPPMSIPDEGSEEVPEPITTWEVGAKQRSLVIEGVVNGDTYVFSVAAVNRIGTGPGRDSKPVVPTRDVPDPPTEVVATALPDGSVELTWTPANGQGHEITAYEVTAVTAGAGAPVASELTDTGTVIPDGELEYGTQYAFTVVAINDIDAGSVASEPTETVVPFTLPGGVDNLRASANSGTRGAINVAWDQGDENGRPTTEYQVTTGEGDTAVTKTTTNTSITLTGFSDGEDVTVTVLQVNEAGAGPAATVAARTIVAPTVSNVRTDSTDYRQMVVKFAHNDGGGAAVCSITVNGNSWDIPCSSGAGGYKVTGLWPDNTYRYTMTVRNDAGSAASGQVTSKTPVLNGTVTCINSSNGEPGYCNSGVGVYTNSRQQSGEAVGSAKNGQRYKAYCKKQGTAGNQSGDATLEAAMYNNYKKSSWWVQIRFDGNQRYIPFIWFNLDDGDNLNNLPNC